MALVLAGALATTAGIEAAQAQARPDWRIAFRGLDGRSTEADVRRTLPEAQPFFGTCEAIGKSPSDLSGPIRCGELRVQQVMVEDVAFEASFIFRSEGTLAYVYLLWRDGAAARARVDHGVAVVRGALEARYGPARAPNDFCFDQDDADKHRRCVSWVDGPHVALANKVVVDGVSERGQRPGVIVQYAFALPN